MKKVLITGFCGMLGGALYNELRTSYDIYGLDIRAEKNCFVVDISDKSKLQQIIKDIKPDLIIHTAALTDVDGCQLNPKKAIDTNSEGTRNVAETARLNNSFLFYISTDYVFDGKKKTPYSETDKPNPINVYGETKLKGENYIKDILDKHIIIRSSGLYGVSGRNFVDTILDKTKKEKELKVVDDQVCSPTYVLDLAGAIGKLIDLVNSEQWTVDSGKTFHITNSGSCSWYEFAKKILEFAKIKDVEIEPITSGELARPAKRPAYSVLDSLKFEKLSGYKLRSWQEALRDYIESL